MGSLFRSEEMTLCQLFLQTEASYACVSELGELGIFQFKDLNQNVNAFQKKFVNEVRRCEEMERKLRYIEKEIKKDELKIPDFGENPKAPAPKEMVDLEAQFEKNESELREVNTNAEALKRNFLELTELREVLKKTQTFFSVVNLPNIVGEAQHALVIEESGPAQAVQLGFIAGVIPREKVPPFERMLWFACRGNVFLRYEEIQQPLEDPHTGEAKHKAVFMIFFQGEQLKARVKKICEGFRAALYPCPESTQERQEMLRGVTTRLEDLKMVLNQTEDHRRRVLVGAQKEIRNWIIKVEKIKAIYHTLNMFSFDISHNSLIAEGWCPVQSLEEVRRVLKEGEKLSGSTIPSILHPLKTKEVPPTFFKTSRFTQGFQNIVDAYGVATYQEVNPMPYTIITFPFLFSVMFGDAGHGTLMFLFGLWMVIKEKSLLSQKSNNEIWNTFFGGRYIIMLMGLFSIYTGMIYNDAFSKSFNIFGSAWHSTYTDGDLQGDGETATLVLDPGPFYRNGTPYPFGIDPIWQSAKNKITFLNSFKMKMAVILGISQMVFGVCLSIFNHLHFKMIVCLFCEFLPELIFLLALFGYLIFMVYYKWLVFDVTESGCAPALLIQYINMFMFKYEDASEKTDCDVQATFYENQQTIQTIFVIMAVLSVPVLLLVKPFYLRSLHNAKTHPPKVEKDTSKSVNGKSKPVGEDVKVSYGHALINHGEDEEEFEFSEIFIEQAIHTIEFCLGCISHTASYLRLWALSLAHAQLSEVLWTMVLHIGLSMDMQYLGGLIIFVVWMFWANLTIAVLLVMEGLSAFLHTLRLHWVEFQSKFYSGNGYLFQPFGFKHILDIDSLQEIK
ncbi:hypothetical protein LOTGIDRAFT_108161 [Lottia gigantea]|uniref:V-type proton ATPase subunit a n=1 Tax=Lottia gigantea TaxID=225164 RepID=V3ZIY7_LOTGI|nr:hypothetical protein LOTGIDRAFT_108161 [Lottia gigantea]ESO84217.1 hypothetical protein LOTGIDRAFT_108161 [Lottia gigantea]